MSGPKRDLVGQLAATATDLAPALGLPDAEALLGAVCSTARRVFRAAACSVAELDADAGSLVYRVADGEGAERITGTRLPLDRGVASYVATSGQALAVDQVHQDPRFATDVAAATGYVPQALLVVPVTATTGGIFAGELSATTVAVPTSISRTDSSASVRMT